MIALSTFGVVCTALSLVILAGLLIVEWMARR